MLAHTLLGIPIGLSMSEERCSSRAGIKYIRSQLKTSAPNNK